jgi:hypothetical protein
MLRFLITLVIVYILGVLVIRIDFYTVAMVHGGLYGIMTIQHGIAIRYKCGPHNIEKIGS